MTNKTYPNQKLTVSGLMEHFHIMLDKDLFKVEHVTKQKNNVLLTTGLIRIQQETEKEVFNKDAVLYVLAENLNTEDFKIKVTLKDAKGIEDASWSFDGLHEVSDFISRFVLHGVSATLGTQGSEGQTESEIKFVLTSWKRELNVDEQQLLLSLIGHDNLDISAEYDSNTDRVIVNFL